MTPWALALALAGCGRDATEQGPSCTGVTFFADADMDAHGDLSTTVDACAAPDGYTTESDDCDDGNAEVHPGADEICNEIDDDCDSLVDSLDPSLTQGTVWYVDADSDGFGDPATGAHACEEPANRISVGEDCDDTNIAINPDADELCNTTDDDCDGAIDEDPIDGATFYADSDGDGLGDADVEMAACTQPSGYVPEGTDCDDGDAIVGAALGYYDDTDGDGYGDGAAIFTCAPAADQVLVDGDCSPADPDVHPGATEQCNSHDDNCDGLVDFDDPLVVAWTLHADDDGDGYGDPKDTLASCTTVAGYVGSSLDCDDTDAAINPRAVEYCDGVDNDCDGSVDVSVVYEDWYADDDGDGFGDPDDTTNDCVQPSGYILADGDCDDTVATTNEGAREVCLNDVDDDCNWGTTDDCALGYADADAFVEGDAQYFGAVLAVADENGDKVADLIVSSHHEDDIGSVFIAAGPVTASMTLADMVELQGTTTRSGFGTGVGGGDMDLDEVDDILVGAPGSESAYLFLGPVTADRASTDADAILDGAGSDVDAIDFDADGTPDLAVSAHRAYFGAVYVVSGPVSAAVDLASDATWVFEGAVDGSDVVDAGDVTGDGIDDLAVPTASETGTLYVVDGGAPSGDYEIDLAASVAIEGPDRDRGEFGHGLVATDYDGDGTIDLVAGAYRTKPSDRGSEAGGVFGFLGPLSGTLDAGDAEVTWVAIDDLTWLGKGIAAGDIDADGSTDLALGAPYAALELGSIYVQFGFASGTVEVETLPSILGEFWDLPGAPVALVPDWTGDGGAEVAFGFPDRSVSGVYVGGFAVFSSETLY